MYNNAQKVGLGAIRGDYREPDFHHLLEKAQLEHARMNAKGALSH